MNHIPRVPWRKISTITLFTRMCSRMSGRICGFSFFVMLLEELIITDTDQCGADAHCGVQEGMYF